MTAAAACKRLGCEVVVFQNRPDLMNLQKESALRFVHPNLFDWPYSRERQPFHSTDLPILNWGAGTAASIRKLVMMQWDVLAEHVDVRLNHEV